MSKLPRSPRVYVGMHDGAEFTLEAWNVDLVAWDRERAKRGWPPAPDAPFLWLTFLAWHHLTNTDQLPRMSLAEFETAARTVISAPDDDDDDGEGLDVDPMNRGAGPG